MFSATFYKDGIRSQIQVPLFPPTLLGYSKNFTSTLQDGSISSFISKPLHLHKARVSQLLVYSHPPASLFYTLLHPHQNFKIAKIFHYFQNIIVFTSFGTLKHQFYFSKHETENYRCKNRGFDCRPTFHAFPTNRSFLWKLFCCKY